MTIEHLIAFNIALFAAVASPGPALLVAMRTTIAHGRKAGMAIGAGLALIASTWTLTALLGLDIVFRLFPWVYGAAKAVGAAYLLYIAYQMWRSAKKPITSDADAASNAFVQGMMINLLNPKSVLFSAAVLVVIFPANMPFTDNLIVMANQFMVEMTFYTGLAFAMNSDLVRARYMRAKAVIDRGAALVLGALGFKLLTER